MRYTPQRLFFVLSLVAVFLHCDAVVSARSRVRKNQTPKSMGRSADPDLSSEGPAIQFQQPAVLLQSQAAEGKAALAMIHFPWQDLGYQVSFMGRRPGYRALTLVDKHEIEIYLKSEEGPSSVAFDLAHEFGHVVDLKYNDEDRRKRWMELRGIDPATPWYGCSACADYDTPAGDFAETFAYLLLGPGSFHSRMAPPPTPDQIRELAEFCKIQDVAAAIQKTD